MLALTFGEGPYSLILFTI